MRNVYANYLRKTSIFQQDTQQFAFTTTKVHDPLRTCASECCNHRVDALLIEVQRLFNNSFLSVVSLLLLVRFR